MLGARALAAPALPALGGFRRKLGRGSEEHRLWGSQKMLEAGRGGGNEPFCHLSHTHTGKQNAFTFISTDKNNSPFSWLLNLTRSSFPSEAAEQSGRDRLDAAKSLPVATAPQTPAPREGPSPPWRKTLRSKGTVVKVESWPRALGTFHPAPAQNRTGGGVQAPDARLHLLGSNPTLALISCANLGPLSTSLDFCFLISKTGAVIMESDLRAAAGME